MDGTATSGAAHVVGELLDERRSLSRRESLRRWRAGAQADLRTSGEVQVSRASGRFCPRLVMAQGRRPPSSRTRSGLVRRCCRPAIQHSLACRQSAPTSGIGPDGRTGLAVSSGLGGRARGGELPDEAWLLQQVPRETGGGNLRRNGQASPVNVIDTVEVDLEMDTEELPSTATTVRREEPPSATRRASPARHAAR